MRENNDVVAVIRATHVGNETDPHIHSNTENAYLEDTTSSNHIRVITIRIEELIKAKHSSHNVEMKQQLPER